MGDPEAERLAKNGPDAAARRRAAGNRRGMIALTLGMSSFAVGDTMMKLAAGQLPTSELLFIRGALVTAIALTAAFATGAIYALRYAFTPAMGLRALGDVAAGWSFQLALARMPYAELVSITQLNPLAMTAASAVFLRERVGWRRWAATAVGLIGVLFVIRPGTASFNWWALGGIGAVLGATVRDLATRRVDPRVPALVIMTLSALAVTLSSAVMAPFDSWQMPGWPLIGMLTAAGIFSLLGQLGVITAMRAGEVSAVAPFRYTIIVFAILSGVLVFGHWPDAMTLLGIMIVAGAGLYTFYREQRLRREAASAGRGAGQGDRG